MRKVLILIALLPGLALADPVGGPSSDTGVQTSSPQKAPATLNLLQPAPNASEQSLAAPSSPANTLQGSIPSSDAQLQVEADGAPQNLPGRTVSNTWWIIGLTLLAALSLAAAATVWRLSRGGQL